MSTQTSTAYRLECDTCGAEGIEHDRHTAEWLVKQHAKMGHAPGYEVVDA